MYRYTAQMRRVFFRNLIFLFLLNLIIKPLWVFGIDRNVQNITGASSYGLYFSLSALSMFFNILIDAVITYYNNRIIAQKPDQISRLIPGIVILKFMLSILYIGITFLAAFLTNVISTQYPLLIMLCANQILLSFIIYLRSNFSGLHYFKTDSVLSIADKLLMILLFGFILINPSLRADFNIEWFIYGQTACYFITLLLATILTMPLLKNLSYAISLGALKTIWLNSYPYVLVIFFMTIYARSDAFIIERISGASYAGHYAAAFRLLDAANQFGYLFAALLLPIFSRMLGNNQQIKDLTQSAFMLIIVAATMIITICTWHSEQIMRLLYNNTIRESGDTLALLTISLLGSFSVYIFGTLLAAAAKLKALNVITALAAVLNIILNMVLIPEYGILGAAYSAIAANVFVALAEYHYIKTRLNLSIDQHTLIRLTLFIILLTSIGWGVKSFITISWIYQCGITISSGVALSFSIGLISLKQLRNLYQISR